MGDFHQGGAVTTLHKLRERPITEIEDSLCAFAAQRPMSLVLPSLYSELEGEALARILDELTQVRYLNEIVIGLDRAEPAEFEHARAYFDRLPQHHRILWHDGPRLQALDALLARHGLAPTEPGKGRNVWYCYGYALASGRGSLLALHDCDILTYQRGLLARLFYPLAHPQLNFYFCKGYYYRAAGERLNGRVTRLLVTPLIDALQRMVGPAPYLDYMASFRYPLAGEFATRAEVVRQIRIPSDWGLEIGVLSEVHRNYALGRICQAEIADAYDHKHQPLSADDAQAGLSKMSTDISKALFRKLATQGVVFSAGSFRTLKAIYYRTALDMVERYYAEAVTNGMQLDRHAEEQAVELFAQNITRAGESFMANPQETPFMPSWQRVVSAVPDFLAQLHEAVERDNA
ncbi:MAG: glycosyl transferase [Pseudomonadota bacterium]|nr:glycosyl transferase [Pseudomonadota bacterium]HJO35343.1 glycosyl transferase [Gammaproteobacteria bacterium]